MTFDDQLQHAFDTLADGLREEIDRKVRAVAADLAEHARNARAAAVEKAVEEAVDAATTQSRAELAQLELRAQEMVEATAAASRKQMRATDLAARKRLIDAVVAIDRARSLSDILDALVDGASREAARVAVLLARHGELRGWRFHGFDASATPIVSLVIAPHDAGIIVDALRSGTTVSADASDVHAAPAFAELPDNRECLAVPIAMSGEVVAVLYADHGLGEPAESLLPLSTWTDALEVMARHAARCLEAATALTAVRTLTGNGHQPDVASTALAIPRIDPLLDGDDAARRYARLLVSEIKLYHESDVVAGRRERDLGTRLGPVIARARASYEDRVPPAARGQVDYFHDEVVRTLADGDPRLLGPAT